MTVGGGHLIQNKFVSFLCLLELVESLQFWLEAVVLGR